MRNARAITISSLGSRSFLTIFRINCPTAYDSASILRALAVEPDIRLMDEPFAALDAQTREVVQAELLRIWGMTGITVIFVTHQVDEAVYLADRVIVMGTRPDRIVDDITVEFPRPRELSLKTTPAFNAISERIWGRLASESDRLKQAETATV